MKKLIYFSYSHIQKSTCLFSAGKESDLCMTEETLTERIRAHLSSVDCGITLKGMVIYIKRAVPLRLKGRPVPFKENGGMRDKG